MVSYQYVLYNFRPPRFMGDGFVVLQSNDVDIYYYHDEPGKNFEQQIQQNVHYCCLKKNYFAASNHTLFDTFL